MGNPYDIPDDDPEYQSLLKQYGVGGAGEKPKNEPGFKSSFKSGLASNATGLGQLAADFVPGVGQDNWLKEYGRGVEEANPSSAASQSWEGFKESPWQGTKEFVGGALGSTLPSVAAALLSSGTSIPASGAAASRGLLARGASWVAANPGQTAIAAVPFYGQTREAQHQGGYTDDTIGDKLGALGASALAGKIESGLGVQRYLGKAGSNARADLVKEFASSPLKTGVKTFGKTGLEESTEEGLQQPLQQMAAYQDPTTEASLRDTGWNMFGGLIGGLGLGGISGGRMGMAHSKINAFRQSDLLNPNTPLETLDDQAKWNQAFIERDEGASAGQRFYEQRQQEIDNYIESLVPGFLESASEDEANAARRAVLEEKGNQFGIGEKSGVKQKDVAAAFGEKTEPTIILNEEGEPFQTTSAYDVYAFNHDKENRFALHNARLEEAKADRAQVEQSAATLPEADVAAVMQKIDQRIESLSSFAPTNLLNPETQDAKSIPPVVETGSQGSGGDAGAGAGNLGNQPVIGRGRNTPAGAPVASGGTNQPVGSSTGGVGAVTAPVANQQVNEKRAEAYYAAGNAKIDEGYKEEGLHLMAQGDAILRGEQPKPFVQGVTTTSAPNTPAPVVEQTTDHVLTRYGIKKRNKDTRGLTEHVREAVAGGDLTTEEAEGFMQKLATIWAQPRPVAIKQHAELIKEVLAVQTTNANAKAAQQVSDEEKVATGWVKSIKPVYRTGVDDQGNETRTQVGEEVSWSPPESNRVTGDAKAEVERVDPDDIQDETHEKAVRMHLAGDSTRAIAKAVGNSHEHWRKVLLDYGYDAKSKAEEDAAEAETGTAFTADASENADGADDTTADANPDVTDNDEYVDHELENQGITIRKASSNSVFGKDRVSTETKLERATREAVEAERLAKDQQATEAALDAVEGNDFSAVPELLALLQGKTGIRMMQVARLHFGLPSSATTPQLVMKGIEVRLAEAAEQLARETQQLATQAEQLGDVWGDGYNELAAEQKLAFARVVQGVGDLIYDPKVLRQVKEEISETAQNEPRVGEPGEAAPGNAVDTSKNQSAGEGRADSEADQGRAPVVQVKKRRTIERPEGEVKRSVRSDAVDRLAAAVEKWKGVVADLVAGKLSPNVAHVLFPSTPASMQALHMPDLPVKVLNHALRYLNDRLTQKQLEQIPAEIADPVAVTMHEEQDGTLSFTFITRLTTANGFLTVGIKPNGNLPQGGPANYVATIVPLTQGKLLTELREGRAAYVGDLGQIPGAKDAFQQGKRESGRQAVNFRNSISRRFNLSTALDKVVYKSDLVKLIDEGKAQFSNSESAGVTNPTTVAGINKLLKGLFFSGKRFDDKVVVVQSVAGLDPDLRSKHDEKTQAFVKGDKVYMIADNIESGKELAVFLHEVGAHLGMEKLLGPENYAKLVEQVKQWAENHEGKEGDLARKALRRVLNAEENLGEEYGQQDFDDELLAYFVEESVLSGVNPTAVGKAAGPMANWFRTFWAAVKLALRKFGLDRIEQLSAQNIVDIAYGAARLELEGTWHGTAADFRNFRHTYMGSGEGAQAFGWGTYLAQRVGIAKEYWKADIGRKGADNRVDVVFPGLSGVEVVRSDSGAAMRINPANELKLRGGVLYVAAQRVGGPSFKEFVAVDQLDLDSIGVTAEEVAEAVQKFSSVNKEGSLMRVDVNVHDDEFLDWDASWGQQSAAVKTALRKANEDTDYKLEAHANRSADDRNGYPGGVSSGEDLYKALVKHFGSGKAASEYLDSIGIKGIKFLDAPSRNGENEAFLVNDAGRSIDGVPLDILERVGAATYVNGKGWSLAPDWKQKLTSWEYAYEKGSKKTHPVVAELLNNGVSVKPGEPQTRNLVIFNDKNIVRVATQRGARRDSGGIKYSNLDSASPSVSYYTATPAEKEFFRSGAFSEYLRDFMLDNGLNWVMRPDVSVFEGRIVVPAQDTNTMRQFAEWLMDAPENRSEIPPQMRDGTFSKALAKAQDTQSGKIRRSIAAPQQEFVNNVKDAASGFAANRVGSLKEIGLGSLTLDQMAELVKSAAVRTYTKVMTDIQRFSKERIYRAALIEQPWAKLDKTVQKNLSQVMRDATRAQYDPAKKGEVADTDEKRAVKRKFDALPPQAKDVYTSVRDYYDAMFEERKQILMDAASKAKAAGKNTREVDALFAKLKGPYFPLMRIGRWYSVGMSDRVADLMKKRDEGSLTKPETDELAKLRKDKNHYVSRGHMTRAEAQRSEKELKAQLGNARSNRSEEKIGSEVASIPDFAKIEAYIAVDMPAEVRSKVKNMVAQMYFDMLPEHNALKRQMKREGIHGEEEDMRRVFAASAMSMSHQIGRLKYANDLSGAMVDVKADGRKDETRRMVANELMTRTGIAMDFEETPITDRLLQASYFAHLGVSPAFWFINMTQVPVITLPWLTARHGLRVSGRALAGAYADTFELIKSTYKGGDWRSEFDWSSKFKEGSPEDRLFRELLDRNLLDITMEHDLGSVVNMANGKLDNTIKMLNLPVRVTEFANRSITALAAYRLAISKPGTSHDAAVNHAIQALNDTQLNYSTLNSPRYMQELAGSKPLARIVFQFRKFQQGMLWLVAKNAYDAVKDESPEVRKEARKMLLGLSATTGLFAGALGLPAAGTLAFIANTIAQAFGDDDEPWDAETELRNWLTDMFGKDAAKVMTKGFPALAGVDLSKRVGLGDVASPLPFARQGKTGTEKLSNTLVAAAGAPFGTMATLLDGAMELAEGNFAKGAEKIVPIKLAQNLIRAGRYGTEGLTDKNGNVIVSDDRFSPWDLAMRGAGFQTTTEADYYEGKQAVENAKRAAMDTRSKLLRKYAQAKLNGESTQSLEADIREFNQRHREKSVRIDGSAKLRSVQMHRKMVRERDDSGIRQDKLSKSFLDEARFVM